jgi:hypothetical protein
MLVLVFHHDDAVYKVPGEEERRKNFSDSLIVRFSVFDYLSTGSALKG